MPADAPWRQNSTQLSCSNLDCAKLFTATSRGKACSGCKSTSYCGSQCQRSDWRRHRDSCKFKQEALREQSADTPMKDRSPNMSQDLSHWIGMSSHAIRATARSALRLGRPDSIAKTHYLFLRLQYIPPPPSRWALTSSKPVGDERNFFRFREITVQPNEKLDEWQEEGAVTSAEKEMHREKIQRASGPGSEAFFIWTFAEMPDCSADAASSQFLSTFFKNQFHTLSYSERQLNPDWQCMIPLGISGRPAQNKQEDYQEWLRIDSSDLALSESLETLMNLTMMPGTRKDGWPMMQDALKKSIPQIRATQKSIQEAMKLFKKSRATDS